MQIRRAAKTKSQKVKPGREDLGGRGSGRIESAVVTRRGLCHVDDRTPIRDCQARKLNRTGIIQDGEMSAVAACAAVVVRTAMVMRMQFHCAFRLYNGKVHCNQQNQQHPGDSNGNLAPTTHKAGCNLDATLPRYGFQLFWHDPHNHSNK